MTASKKRIAIKNKENNDYSAQLETANRELIFLIAEKEKRAAELLIANTELLFQNTEKEKRAAELIRANQELVFQNEEKEKRAEELVIANRQLAFEKEEKEKRAAELSAAHKELEAFTFISSHDLQEPLRKIQTFAGIILANEYANLSESGQGHFERIQHAAWRMQMLINDLLAYSRTKMADKKFEHSKLSNLVDEVKTELKEELQQKHATIEVSELCEIEVIPGQFRQLLRNLINNSLKFSQPGIPPHIVIESRYTSSGEKDNDGCHITISDNGIGFDPQYKDRIFEIFQRLHLKDAYKGTGIGLTIAKKIVENHNGTITATGELNKGASFEIFLPSARMA